MKPFNSSLLRRRKLAFGLAAVIMLVNLVAGPTVALADQTPLPDPDAPQAGIQGPFTSPPVVPTVFEGDVRNLPQIKDDRLIYQVENEDETEGPAGEAVASGPDGALQKIIGPLSMPSPIQNFAGLDLNTYGNGWPPDTNGDVGPRYYIQTVNTSIGIYDKATGTRQAVFGFNGFWDGTGTVCDNNNYGDPVVLYDMLADRWVLTDFAFATDTSGNPVAPFYECIAVSRTSDPLAGGWYLYPFQADASFLNDYPKLSVWPDGYYMSANMFQIVGGSSLFRYPRVWALDRVSMLAGSPLREVHFNLTSSYFALLPANLRGQSPAAGSPNPFMSASSGSSTLYLWKFHTDYNTPANSTFTGPTSLTPAAYAVLCSGMRDCISQPDGGTQKLDAISNRLMMQLQYRRNPDGSESLWVNHTVDAGSSVAGVRWYEIRNPFGTPSINQNSTYNPSSDSRWMGSVAADRLGNMAVGYSVSSASVYPSIRYAGRLASDAINTLGQGEATLIAGAGSQEDGGAASNYGARWGDYSAMSVDPEDDCTFWYTNEYYAVTGDRWLTRIGSFKYPSCTSTINWVGGTSSDWSNSANWNPAVLPTRYDDVVIDPTYKTTYWPTVNANGEAHSVSINNGGQLNATASFTLSVYGNWTQAGSGAFNATAGTVLLQGAAPMVNMGTPGANNHFYHLQAGDGTRTPIVTLASDLRVDGNLTFSARTILDPGTYLLQVGGNYSNQGAMKPGSSTLRFSGVSSTLTLANLTYQNQVTLFSENFDSWPLPAGWTITGANCVWMAGNTEASPRPNKTGGGAEYAIADSNYCGASKPMDTDLRTPVLNLTAAVNPTLQFKSDMRWLANDQYYVDLSLDGGSTWSNLLHRQSQSYRGAETITLSLSAAAGQSNVRVRFRYTGNNDYYWEVDEVRVFDNPTVPAVYNLETSGTGTLALGSNLYVGNNLTVNAGTTFNLAGYSTTVEGALTNNGIMRQTLSVPASSTTSFMRILNRAGTTTKYYGVDLTPSGAMGSSTVQIRGNQISCNQGDQLIHRCFDLAVSSPQSATVRFWYLNSERGNETVSQMNAYHWNGTSHIWEPLTLAATPRGTLGPYEWTEAVNVTSYSPFGLSDGTPSNPTNVNLVDFGGHANNDWMVAVIFFAGLLFGGGLLAWKQKREQK